MKKYFAVYLKNLSVRVLFFWREVAGATVMLIFNWPHFSVSPNCCHEMRLPLLIKIYLLNKRNISKHGMNWDTGIAALKNKISHAQDKEVFNAVEHISYCTKGRKGLAIHCPKLCHFWAIVGQLCQLRGEAGLWLVSCVSWCESCALIGQRPLPGVWRSMSMTYCGGSQELGSPHTSPSPHLPSLPLRHFLCSFSPHGEGNGLELVANLRKYCSSIQ